MRDLALPRLPLRAIPGVAPVALALLLAATPPDAAFSSGATADRQAVPERAAIAATAPAPRVAALPDVPAAPRVPGPALRAGEPAADDLTADAGASLFRAHQLNVPVLMYHYISDVPAAEAASLAARDLRVPPALFAQHLEVLKNAGYHTITAPSLWAALSGRSELPDRPILLTFDDGYADAYANALPLLLRYGFTGTFFVTVNLVGRPGYLTWEQVGALVAAGMDVESHAMDHVSLAKRTGAALAGQLRESRRILAERTGTDVRFFAYPAGEYSEAAMAAARDAGYDGAFLKNGGAQQSPAWAYALRRSRISGYTAAAGLRALLATIDRPAT